MTSTIVPTKKQIYQTGLNTYKKNLRHYILTSRFNTTTWEENSNYRKLNPKIGCIYCSPCPVSINIPNEAMLFVLEMNNDTNKICGIGLILNKPWINKWQVYENGNYNRYSFMGKCRIGREEMTVEEDTIMRVFDILCFTGNRHMKRGQGLTSFPIDMLYKCHKKLDLVEFIRNMFKVRFSK